MPMWGYSSGMGGMLWTLSMLMCLFVFGLLIWGILSLMERRAQHSPASDQAPSALETLRRRYAHGEIDDSTYQRMSEQLAARNFMAPTEHAR